MNEDDDIPPSDRDNPPASSRKAAVPASPSAGHGDETLTQPGAPPPFVRGSDVHSYIGRQLRAVYDDVARQPVPERFLELMKQLETGGR